MNEAVTATPTPPRFAIATAILLFAISSAPQGGYAQQVTSDVVISGAAVNDGYIYGGQCDSEGGSIERVLIGAQSLPCVSYGTVRP